MRENFSCGKICEVFSSYFFLPSLPRVRVWWPPLDSFSDSYCTNSPTWDLVRGTYWTFRTYTPFHLLELITYKDAIKDVRTCFWCNILFFSIFFHFFFCVHSNPMAKYIKIYLDANVVRHSCALRRWNSAISSSRARRCSSTSFRSSATFACTHQANCVHMYIVHCTTLLHF